MVLLRTTIHRFSKAFEQLFTGDERMRWAYEMGPLNKYSPFHRGLGATIFHENRRVKLVHLNQRQNKE